MPAEVPAAPEEPEPEVNPLLAVLADMETSQAPAADEARCPSCGAGVSSDAVICIGCGTNLASGKRLKTKTKKVKRSAKGAGTSAAGAAGGVAGDGGDKERHGQDDVSKQLFLLYALCVVGVWIYVMSKAYMFRSDMIERHNLSQDQVGNFPFGGFLLALLLFAVVQLALITPYNMLGVWITAKMMKLDLRGSVYLNTLGWMSLPGIFATVGWVLGGGGGLLIAFFVALLLTVPAFGYLHGLRIVEAIIGYVLTMVMGFAGAIASLIVVSVMGVAVGVAAESLFQAIDNAGTGGGGAMSHQAGAGSAADQFLEANPSQAAVLSVSGALRRDFEGEPGPDQSAEEIMRSMDTVGATIWASNISDRTISRLNVKLETSGVVNQTHHVDLCADGPLGPDEEREVNVRFRNFTPPEEGGMIEFEAVIEDIVLAPAAGG
ncbi:MAG: zinc ribbon domain-containing protein [Phycisphaeraceae bacterium]